jgi:hypothetical protein
MVAHPVVHGPGSGWQSKVLLSATAIVAAIICVPYALRVAYELMRPFAWLFHLTLLAAVVGGLALLYKWWRDWYY